MRFRKANPSGNVTPYYCEYAKKNRKNFDCDAVMRVRRLEDRSIIIVETSGQHTDHESIDTGKVSKLTPEVKARIKELSKDFTPAAIKLKLQVSTIIITHIHSTVLG